MASDGCRSIVVSIFVSPLKSDLLRVGFSVVPEVFSAGWDVVFHIGRTVPNELLLLKYSMSMAIVQSQWGDGTERAGRRERPFSRMFALRARVPPTGYKMVFPILILRLSVRLGHPLNSAESVRFEEPTLSRPSHRKRPSEAAALSHSNSNSICLLLYFRPLSRQSAPRSRTQLPNHKQSHHRSRRESISLQETAYRMLSIRASRSPGRCSTRR